jgi:hypothetical protein
MPGKPAPENLAGEGAGLPNGGEAGEGAARTTRTPHPARCSLALATRHPLPQGERVPAGPAFGLTSRLHDFAAQISYYVCRRVFNLPVATSQS